MTLPDPDFLQTLLDESARRHQHLCPRQVLGIRLGLAGLRALALLPGDCTPFQNADKRLLTIVETDGCGADGLAVATACSVGRRTLRVLDFGKVAATLVDTHTGRAVRVHPSPASRQLAASYAPNAPSQWHAYLFAYQRIPDEALVTTRPVRLTQSLAQLLSRPDARAQCAACGEEIINEREVVVGGQTLCRHCAGEVYYEPLP